MDELLRGNKCLGSVWSSLGKMPFSRERLYTVEVLPWTPLAQGAALSLVSIRAHCLYLSMVLFTVYHLSPQVHIVESVYIAQCLCLCSVNIFRMNILILRTERIEVSVLEIWSSFNCYWEIYLIVTKCIQSSW